MKTDIKNVSGSYLALEDGTPWELGATVTLDLPKDLIEYRVKLGLYKVVLSGPPVPKRRTVKKRASAKSPATGTVQVQVEGTDPLEGALQ